MSKKMTVEEAKKILTEAEEHLTVDKSDNLSVSVGGGPSPKEIAEATEVLKQANDMTIQEARRVLSKIDPSKRMIDDDRQIEIAWRVMREAMDTERANLEAGKIRPNQVEYISQKDAYDILRQHAAEERAKGEKSFFGRLFSKKEAEFYWENPTEWQDVKFDSKGEFLFSHQIDLEYLTPSQEKQVREGLKKHGIHFVEKSVSHTVEPIKAGDHVLRISDKESIEKLRSMVFHWAQGPFARPVSMSYLEHNELNRKKAQKKPVIVPQKPREPTPEPERPFRWDDPMCWQDVKFKQGNEIIFSHRIRLEGLTPDQEKEVRDGLNKYHINFEEREASATDGKIEKGDRTLRISDKEGVEQLRSMVFHWATGPFSRPVSMPLKEYYQQGAKPTKSR